MKKWIECIATAVLITMVLALDIFGIVLFNVTMHFAYLIPVICSFIAFLATLIYCIKD